MPKLTMPRPGIGLFCLIAILILLLVAVIGFPDVTERLRSGDNDHLMRLVSLRDWLGGQSYYDTHQYRLLPPGGVEMHWSRYVDLGLAAIYLPAEMIFGPATGEALTLTLWPALLGIGLILVTGLGAGRLFGPIGALGALVFLLSWRKLFGEFGPGRIDHHNLQLLAASLALYLALLPGRPVLYGAAAGAVSAFSMAIGLEMLPFFLLLHGLCALRFVFARPGSGAWLMAFALGQACAAPLFLAGQVPLSAWGVMHCDVLAPPLLALFLAGQVTSLLPVLAGGWLKGAALRFGLMLALALAGLWLASDLLLPCLAGPYADVTPEARRIIDTLITEARSIPDLIRARPGLVAPLMLPVVLLTGLGLGFALCARRQLSAPQGEAIVIALILALSGVLIALTQIRAINLAAPALPLIAGFVGARFVQLGKDSRARAPLALVILLSLPPVPELISGELLKEESGAPRTAARQDAAPRTAAPDCRGPEEMERIAALPAGSVVFSTMNLGVAILVYTPQSITSAPYHRSSDAFFNGYGAFAGPEELRLALSRSGADYLALCAEGRVERQLALARDLLEGRLPGWLQPEPGAEAGTALHLFRVDRAALDAGTGPLP